MLPVEEWTCLTAPFTIKKSFTDSSVPAGLAPYGIQDFNGLLYVTFAGGSNAADGFIDIFAEERHSPEATRSRCAVESALGLGHRAREFRPVQQHRAGL